MFRFDQPATARHRTSIDRRTDATLHENIEDFANDDANAPRERAPASRAVAGHLRGLTVLKHGRGVRIVRPDGLVAIVSPANSNHDPSPVTPALAA